MKSLGLVLVLALCATDAIGHIPDLSDQVMGFNEEKKELLNDVAAQNYYVLNLRKGLEIIGRREAELRDQIAAAAQHEYDTAKLDLDDLQQKMAALETQRAVLMAKLRMAPGPQQVPDNPPAPVVVSHHPSKKTHIHEVKAVSYVAGPQAAEDVDR